MLRLNSSSFLLSVIPSPVLINDRFGNRRIFKNTKVEILICDLYICDDRERNDDRCADCDD